MKVVNLDKNDINHLLRLILEDKGAISEAKRPSKSFKQPTSPTELADTKGELRQQAIANINNLVNDPAVGSIVALFLFVLTDESSVMTIRQIAHKYNDHLEGGGKELNFSAAVAKALRPIASKFVNAVVKAVKAKSQTYSKGGILGRDYDQSYLDENANNYYDLRASTPKNQLRQMAIKAINQLANNKDVYQVVSMFLAYLTDKDVVNTLKAFAATYGKKLDQYMDDSDPSWTDGLVKQVRAKFTPLIENMAEAVDKQLRGVQNQDKTANNSNSQFQEDKAKFRQIVQKYNIK